MNDIPQELVFCSGKIAEDLRSIERTQYFIYQLVNLSSYLLVYLFTHPFLSIYLSTGFHLFIYPFVFTYLSIH